jgi:hypothetical protein
MIDASRAAVAQQRAREQSTLTRARCCA